MSESAATPHPSTGEAPAHRLEPLGFPLHGSRLIEASAGTGKTWTIAALYLRLVLGHGRPLSCNEDLSPTAFIRPLRPAEILVMTFTRAATRELSERIRARLLEAARVFRDEGPAQADDPLLAELLAHYPDEAARGQAAWRLAMAAEAMDDAAIFTIDAWCQRMLREHAFDSGNPFDETLAADESALLLEATHDYWRQQGYPLAPETLEAVLKVWPDVAALHADMRELVGQPLPEASATDSLGQCVEGIMGPRRQALREMSAGWVTHVQTMRDWLDTQLETQAQAWDGRKLRAAYYTPWLDALEAWARQPLTTPLALTDAARARLVPDGLRQARRDGGPIPDLPEAFPAFEALLAAYDALPDPRVAMRMHAARRISQRLALLKRRAQSFGFADMLERLDRALSGPQGERLRERILSQYPVALIDEFQDTSPLQYRLFDALYRTAENHPERGLFLIGDPKQSIYGFRGADIYSYLQARQATAGRHYALATNFRSTGSMVTAVNAWFQQAEARPDEAEASRESGAFLFRTPEGNALPFEPVSAKGRTTQFQTAHGPVPALQIAYDLALRNAESIRRVFAEHCAEQIVTWLNDPQAGFAHAERGLTRLRPADIAVLVRTGTEAAAVRQALRRRVVASVYLSDKDSIFASDEARDLLHWLRAVAAPLDGQLVRAALATPLMGLSIEALGQLAHDDSAFDARSEEMRQLHGVWRSLGVLTMLRRTLHRMDLPARWLNAPDGERRLTNYLHLAELLQQASAQLDGEAALIRWLAIQIEEEASGSDEQIVRLESDADLVKVVTIHKSKGLEYAVVCLPFACSLRQVERRNTRLLKLADACGARTLKLDFDENDLKQADHERLREDLRLFYVALTRASHAVWMGFAALKIGNNKVCLNHRTAPGYLLGGLSARSEQAWLEPLQTLAEQARAAAGEDTPVAPIVLTALDADPSGGRADETGTTNAEPTPLTRLKARETPPTLQERPAYTAEFERRWTLGSFSSLVRDLGAKGTAGTADAADTADPPLAPTHVHQPALDEGYGAQPAPGGGTDGFAEARATPKASNAGEPLKPWYRFPRGLLAGNFLHDQLEWLAGERFALAQDPALEAGLRRRCARAGREAWADETLEWMRALLGTPLPSVGTSLETLRAVQPEMEFWMPSPQLHAQDVDRLCQRHLLDGLARPALAQRTLNGMLMGFADLVFEHEGRYWVLDYKSNHLGDEGKAYDEAALRAQMAEHRYDVQAVIYLLALHRLLRARMGPRYRPAQHLGGALYFFLRGIEGPTRGEYAVLANAEVLALLDTLDALLTNEVARV